MAAIKTALGVRPLDHPTSTKQMASAFWTLEDGRTLARRWTGMTYMLELITRELKEIPGAEPLYAYLEKYVFREEHGDTPNGFGGFIRGEENIIPNFE